jgi:hypothetical protein
MLTFARARLLAIAASECTLLSRMRRVVGRLLGQADAVAGGHVHVDPAALPTLPEPSQGLQSRSPTLQVRQVMLPLARRCRN